MNISEQLFIILFIFVLSFYRNMEEQIKLCETKQFRAIFPCNLNANETLFGGEALKWMDEVAYITATRFARERMFTVNTEKIKFLQAVNPNSIVEIIGKVEKVKWVRVYVTVEMYAEEMYGTGREKVMEGTFVFVARDENQKPKQLGLTKSLKTFLLI
jgi:acyl-CoA hydrolase